jgi:HK97 family phage prohead protease
MPYPNEHACRLREPGQFQDNSFRTMSRDHEGKKYSVIMGKLKGEDTMTEQAYRYAKDTWTATQAKSHCSSHDGSFEAASTGGRAMQHVRMKSVEGLWEEKDIPGDELTKWFEDHTKDGIVCDDIILFTDAVFKSGEEISWIMSDMSLDRDSERVDPAGADMKNYKKNPVVLWAHDSHTPAIGKVINPRVKDGQLIGKVQFDSKENDPFAGMIEGKVKAGIIQAGSIGFKPNSVEFIEESKDPTRLIHRKWELLEFSICNVPANSNAMAQNMEETPEVKTEEKAAGPDPLQMRLDSLEAQVMDLMEEAKGKKKSYIETLLTTERSSLEDMLTAKSENNPSNSASPLDAMLIGETHNGTG